MGKPSLGNVAIAPQIPDVRATRGHQAQRPLEDDYRESSSQYQMSITAALESSLKTDANVIFGSHEKADCGYVGSGFQ
jgi:hypothetical protein